MLIETLFAFFLEAVQRLLLVGIFSGIPLGLAGLCFFFYKRNSRRKILLILALIILLIFTAFALFILSGVRWCAGCQEWH